MDKLGILDNMKCGEMDHAFKRILRGRPSDIRKLFLYRYLYQIREMIAASRCCVRGDDSQIVGASEERPIGVVEEVAELMEPSHVIN